MKKAIYLSVVAAGLLLVSSADSVQAQEFIYKNYVGSGSRFGNFFERPYATDRIPTPPYFALHPPVYYSHAVPRTYGYSPFAYPGITRTPEVVAAPEPKVIENPHATPAESTAKKFDPKVTSNQVELINPFFVPRTTRVVSREAK